MKLNVGVTGSSGFIGTHLVEYLRRKVDVEVMLIEDALFQNKDQLTKILSYCDVVVHLAGMNRGDDDEIYRVNLGLVEILVECLKKVQRYPHILFASSILAETDTAFGRSKRDAGAVLENWAKEGAMLSSLIIPNVFGDGGRPFYNSVVATFCYQLTHGQEPNIITDKEVEFIYINDLVKKIYEVIISPATGTNKVRIHGTDKISVSALLDLLKSFKKCYYEIKTIPTLADTFSKNLYNVFLSYLNYDDLVEKVEVTQDNRGKLFEIVKHSLGGQVFFSTTNPGIIRGNHYHTRKIEKFCVIEGEAVIRLRKIGHRDIKEYKVNSNYPAFIQIPIFHTHHIENVGDNELHTLFWVNEVFNPADADTYYEEVILS